MEDTFKRAGLSVYKRGDIGQYVDKGNLGNRNPSHAVNAAYRWTRNWLINRWNTPVMVLFYHRVTTLPKDQHLIVGAVSPANFRAQLAWLRRRHPILRLESDWSRVREPSVAITFDDGYADNAHEALPILEELEVPATFFVSTGYIGSSREFWWDELARIMLGHHSLPLVFEYGDVTREIQGSTVTPSNRRSLFWRLHSHLKRLDAEARTDWMSAIRRWACIDTAVPSTHLPMDETALTRLASSPFATIGAHTVSHAQLSSLPLEQQRIEVADSKAHLEKQIGKPVTLFSYPFGKPVDYSNETVRIVREAGYTKAFCAAWGRAYSWTDCFQIPRISMSDWGEPHLRSNFRKCWVG